MAADRTVVVRNASKEAGAKGSACSVSSYFTTSNGMIDYYEIKSQPITRAMVIKAYAKVKSNKGSGGIDGMSWAVLEQDPNRHLYQLWNRLSSGSYFPPAVKEVEIAKKDGGVRRLGIPTILDRIAQEVVKAHLERMVEPYFHTSSYGYRPARSCHDAVNKALSNIMTHDWVIDLDIESFFDTIDHELMMKAVSHYCKEKWVLMYVFRWLKAGVISKAGCFLEKHTGTPQGGVISPLLANIFLHIVVDKWMDKNHGEKPFVRYADDMIIHCKTDKQARYVLTMISRRLADCKLKVHPVKTRIVNMRGNTRERYPRSFNFLGFTFKPYWSRTAKGFKVLITVFMSRQSGSSVLSKLKALQIHKRRKPLAYLAKLLNPITRGVINYYCKLWSGHTDYLWHQLNNRLLKWVRWEKGLSVQSAIRWLKTKYKEKPDLFYHWKIVHP